MTMTPEERAASSHQHIAPADHPHTDPGDGRTECDTCGKYVWPFLHSCKGVPVTDAAMKRFTSKG